MNVPGSLVILYLIDSSMFKFIQGPVRVVTEGIAMEKTFMPVNDLQIQLDRSIDMERETKPFVSAAYEVDVNRFSKYYESIMVANNSRIPIVSLKNSDTFKGVKI